MLIYRKQPFVMSFSMLAVYCYYALQIYIQIQIFHSHRYRPAATTHIACEILQNLYLLLISYFYFFVVFFKRYVD